MSYTVNEVAKLAGISVRTLHYYDEVGLLKPSVNPSNGYRNYDEAELLRLQQVLFFRELEFTLDDIKQILDSPDFDTIQALDDHKKMIELNIKRMQGLLNTIDKTKAKLKGEHDMKDNEYFENLVKENEVQYGDEVRAKYGKDAYAKTKDWKGKDYKKVFEEGEQITKELVALIKQGKKPGDAEVQEVMERHYQMIGKFWEVNPEAYKNLGQMYVDDDRFTKNIDIALPGLAKFMHEAMTVFADGKSNS
jgi:DNA-binding transcriptional MerR regulator